MLNVHVQVARAVTATATEPETEVGMGMGTRTLLALLIQAPSSVPLWGPSWERSCLLPSYSGFIDKVKGESSDKILTTTTTTTLRI
jgi:hypothetical protein